MSLGYAEKLSYREDVGTVGMSEVFDPPDILQHKIEELAMMIQKSKHVVAFTGAGISTSCGIPDFRGPKGVWTLQRKGKGVPEASLPFHRAMPSLTHMALVELERAGILKFVISQTQSSEIGDDVSTVPAPTGASFYDILALDCEMVRRYVYNDVVRLDDLEKLIDCSYVQPYTINSAKVIFLKPRPQSRPFKGSGNICLTCDRILQEPFHFCSLSCKVDHVMLQGEDLSSILFRFFDMIENDFLPDEFFDMIENDFLFGEMPTIVDSYLIDDFNILDGGSDAFYLDM